MLEFKSLKEKEVRIIDLEPGDIFVTATKKFSFVRTKRGFKNMVATEITSGQDYNIKINGFDATKNVIGKLKVSKTAKKDVVKDNSILIKDVELDESVVIMTGRGNNVPQLYTLVEVKKTKSYSHTFKNPVTGKKENFRGNDAWKVYRLKDIIK